MVRLPPIGIRLKERHQKKIEELIERGEFEGWSDFLHEAVSFYLEHLQRAELRRLGGAEVQDAKRNG